MGDYQRIICVDFDGVIHSYTSGWKGDCEIPDSPVEGAIEWLGALVSSGIFQPVIYSSRSKNPEAIECMKDWLFQNGMPTEILNQIEFPTQKPPAYLTVDDRAICFTGKFPTQAEMSNFKPWNKQ